MGIQGLRSKEEHEAEAALKHRPYGARANHPFTVACSDADREPGKVEELFQALTEARKQAGDTKSATLDSFQKFVRQKTDQIRKQYKCQTVEYSVELQNGQVKLTAKPKT